MGFEVVLTSQAQLDFRDIINYLLYKLKSVQAADSVVSDMENTIERLSRGKLAIGMKYRDGWLWGALALTGVNFIIKNALLLAGTDLLELAGHI